MAAGSGDGDRVKEEVREADERGLLLPVFDFEGFVANPF